MLGLRIMFTYHHFSPRICPGCSIHATVQSSSSGREVHHRQWRDKWQKTFDSLYPRYILIDKLKTITTTTTLLFQLLLFFQKSHACRIIPAKLQRDKSSNLMKFIYLFLEQLKVVILIHNFIECVHRR